MKVYLYLPLYDYLFLLNAYAEWCNEPRFFVTPLSVSRSTVKHSRRHGENEDEEKKTNEQTNERTQLLFN